MKCCPRCEKHKDEICFSKNKNTKDGLCSWCRECNTKNARQWAVNNKERRRRYLINYGIINEEKCKKWKDKYYQKNKAKVIERAAKWNKENSEWRREAVAYSRQKHYMNPKNVERRREYNRKYRRKNRKDGREYYQKNRERINNRDRIRGAVDRINLFDRYIKERLRDVCGIPVELITKELMDAKREQLRLREKYQKTRRRIEHEEGRRLRPERV